MKRRTRINYTPKQKAIIWGRYRQGDSLHDIARMFDRYHSSIIPTIHQRSFSTINLQLIDRHYPFATPRQYTHH